MARLARVPWAPIILVAAFLVPVVGSRFYVFLANDIVIWALFATSLNLLVGVTGLVSFGHAAYFGIGAYTPAC
jgi:branched-chain amino acid transport system permease protein